MLVTDIKQRMPLAEYYGWIEFFRRRNEEKEQADNPLSSGDAMLRAFKLG